MTAFKPGETLGRYRIERPLGQGAMGEVYLARDPQIDRPLAVKTLRLVGVREEEVAERKARMLREARTAGRLIHPHIVTLFDAGEQDGLLFLAFEYVPGSDLAVRLAAGPLPVGEALRVVREACEGLAHAHREGIVHRDVKPSNLMLDAQGRVKISDFGIAKLGGEATELTVTGMVMGSPHYMSPEQIRGEELDGRSDLFSLGIVLYEALSGRRPFVGDTISTLVFQIVGSEPLPIVALRPGLDALPALLSRLLAKDREARFPDAAAAGAEMARLEAELPAELLAAPAVGTAAPTDATVVMPESDGTGVPSAAVPATSEPAKVPVPPPPVGPASGPTPAPGSAATPLPPTLSASVSVPPPPPGAAASTPAVTPPGAAGRSVAPPVADAGAGRAALAGGGSYAVPSLAGSSRRRLLVAVVVVAVLALAGVAGLALLKRTGGGEAGSGGEMADAGAAGTEVAPMADGGATAAGDGATLEESSDTEAGSSAEAGGAQADPRAEGRRPPSSQPPATGGRPSAGGGMAGAPTQVGAATPTGAATAAGGSGTSGPATPAPGGARPGASQPAGDASGRPEVRPSDTPSTSAPSMATPRPTPEAPSTTPPPSSDEPADAGARGGGDAFAGPVLDTGMNLFFEVRPPDAFVLLDGTVIGRAAEYGRAARRPFALPSPGVHRITLRRDGMKDHELRVRASSGGPQLSPIRVRMEPLDATDTPLSELEMYRVREAVAFKVDPPTARLLVDGEPRGLANRWSGGRFRRDTWLDLPLGIHRLSFVAPGRKRIDFAVDVTAGASEGRRRIEMVLPPLGDGGG